MLKPFLDLPSKDNGFDVEGLAVKDETVLLGLRGPVLRGRASILQLRPEAHGDAGLKLRRFGEDGKKYLHHVLELDGLGIRDLCAWGDDVLILAGPTMALDGPVRVYRWADAFSAKESCFVSGAMLTRLFELPWGEGVNHAEGMTLTTGPDGKPALLVVYDSPAGSRLHGGDWYEADLFSL